MVKPSGLKVFDTVFQNYISNSIQSTENFGRANTAIIVRSFKSVLGLSSGLCAGQKSFSTPNSSNMSLFRQTIPHTSASTYCVDTHH